MSVSYSVSPDFMVNRLGDGKKASAALTRSDARTASTANAGGPTTTTSMVLNRMIMSVVRKP